MKNIRVLILSTLIIGALSIMSFGCSPQKKDDSAATVTKISKSTIDKVTKALIEKHGEAGKDRIERGVKVVSNLWNGSEKSLKNFACRILFQTKPNLMLYSLAFQSIGKH